jgi:hypothetical protein
LSEFVRYALRVSRNESEKRIYLSLSPFPLAMNMRPPHKVEVVNGDIDQLGDAHGGIEKQPEHDLVLKIAGTIDGLIELFETLLGRAAGSGRWAQSCFLPDRLANCLEGLIVEPVAPDNPADLRNEFRLLICGLEMWCLSRAHSYPSALIVALEFRFLALMRNWDSPRPESTACHFEGATNVAKGGTKGRYELLQSKPPQPKPS